MNNAEGVGINGIGNYTDITYGIVSEKGASVAGLREMHLSFYSDGEELFEITFTEDQLKQLSKTIIDAL